MSGACRGIFLGVYAQMHDVNNELLADKSKMNIVLEPRDKHIIVLMTTTKLYMHTKVARHFESNPNMQMFVQILLRNELPN